MEIRILSSAISRNLSICSLREDRRSRISARLIPSCASISARTWLSLRRISTKALLRMISSRFDSCRSSWSATSSSLASRNDFRRSSISTSSSRVVSSRIRSRSVSKVRRSLRRVASISDIIAFFAACSRLWNSVSRRSVQSTFSLSNTSVSRVRNSFSWSYRNLDKRF